METFSWSPGWKIRCVMLVAGVALCLSIWLFLPADQERTLALWALLLPALLMIQGVNVVDSDRRKLVRRWQWMGFLPLGKKEVALDEFEAVTLRGIEDPQPGDPVYLMMVRKDGRFVRIGFFPERAIRKGVALDSLKRLSQATGLPSADYPARAYTRPLSIGN
jgi:hypothetical protein